MTAAPRPPGIATAGRVWKLVEIADGGDLLR
jgi:hypothetical protein